MQTMSMSSLERRRFKTSRQTEMIESFWFLEIAILGKCVIERPWRIRERSSRHGDTTKRAKRERKMHVDSREMAKGIGLKALMESVLMTKKQQADYNFPP